MRIIPPTLLALAVAVATPAPALAAPPVRQTIVQHNVVQDQGQACGFPVRWTIDLTVERFRFFDESGATVRIIDHVREDNTIENLTTGTVLREGPDAFQQVISFEEGRVTQVAINGLSVNVEGEQLKDVGRVVLEGGVIVFSAGPHDVREAVRPGRPLTDALVAFCEVLA